MKKILLALLLVGCVLATKAQQVREPGSTTKQDCNTCRCSEDGMNLACTRRFCVPEPEQMQGDAPVVVDDAKQVCTPNEVKMEDCNRCKCANNGIGWFCTRKSCTPREKRGIVRGSKQLYEGTPNTPGFSCQKGKSFQYDCNTCTCSRDGKSAQCTYKLCENVQTQPQIQPPRDYDGVPNTPGFSCQAGKTFPYECNICTCSRNGKSADCTFKVCETEGPGPLPPFQPELPAIQPPKDYEGIPNTKGFKCTKGKTFQYECNTFSPISTKIVAHNLENGHENGENVSENGENVSLLPMLVNHSASYPAPKAFCTCSRNGKSAQCTYKLCNRKKRDAEWGEFKGIPNTDDFSCTPKTSFKYECNTCRCADNGKEAACSYRLCIPGEFRKKRQTNSVGIPNTPGFSCTPGSNFKYECNNCRCGLDGRTAACTFRFCLPGESRKKRQIAVPIPEIIPNTESEKCVPGTSWNKDCNTCFCTETGLGACTLRACLPRDKREASNEQPKCVPGTTFRDAEDCNDCFCTPDGHVACTEKLCIKKPKRQANIPNTPGFTCSPGKPFKWECNNCRCASDGKTAACTAKLCIPGEF